MTCDDNIKVIKNDLEIIQGSDTNDFSFVITEDDDLPVNLTGFTAAMHIRLKHNSSNLFDELTTENGRIVIESFQENSLTYWSVTVKFPSNITKNYRFSKGVYDIELYNGAIVDRVFEGGILINPEVTRQ